MDDASDSDNEGDEKPIKAKDDAIQECMGPMGMFHLLIYVLIFTTKMTTCFQTLGIVFLAPPVQYLCMDNTDNATVGTLNTCPCNNPKYDRSLFTETIITTWDLICEREWLVSVNQTIFMLGLLVGSICFGSLSDRFGRRATLLVSAALEVSAGVLASVLINYWLFLFLRFLLGCSIGGIMVIGFVLMIEFTGVRYREMAACLLQLPFNFGYLLMPGVGYFIRSWMMIHLVFSITPIFMLIFYWLIPESPRWLLATGKTDQAIEMLEKAAKLNNLPTEGIREKVHRYLETKPAGDIKKATVTDIFLNKNLRKNVMCMSINWIVCAFGFFGLSQYIGQLGGDIFVNNAISASLTFLGTFFTYVGLNVMGRRTAMLGMHAATSLCLLIIALIPEKFVLIKVILACIGNLGMFILISVIYLYCSELFPTVVRNAAVGLASMLSRIGSMSAPFVVSLNSTIPWLPPVIFGVLPLFAILFCLVLPETKGRELPNSLTEGEAFGLMNKKKKDTNIKKDIIISTIHQN